MAPCGAGVTLGCTICHDYREASPLKLGPEHVPFPCSLRELVLDRYAEPPGIGSAPHPMHIDELLEYLKNVNNFNLSPWAAIVGQTEAIGDPASPSREQIAILRWLGKALETWEQQFPLEGRLAAQVRRLKPLLAALAILDPGFMQPGAHPLHDLLDSIQARAIGWQPRLDRMGTVLEQQVTLAVDRAREWFDNKSIDLAGICTEFSAAADRDRARAQRMVQRVVEAEAGKVKTAAAKQEAALMINAVLEKYPAPEEIGDFVKGPWYTSAQLLLLKFGSESEQWRQMSATTETLLDSLQGMEELQEPRRQHIFEVVTQLPKEMRRWLLSLHHDTEAVNEAMGLVEFTHLRILRGQALELRRIEPIVVEGDRFTGGSASNPAALKNWQEGQWFSINSDEEGVVRVQLVLLVELSQQLLFTNMAGVKVLQLSFAEFSRLITAKKVKVLESGASFSLCLAYAVGIDSVEILDALVSAMSEIAQEPAPQPAPQPKSKSVSKSKKQQGQERALEPETKPEPATELEAATEPELTVESAEPVAPLQPASPEQEPEAGVIAQEFTDKKAWGGASSLSDQSEEFKVRGRAFIQPENDFEGGPGQDSSAEPLEVGTGPELSEQVGAATAQNPPEEIGAEPVAQAQGAEERQINLPMGAWLGFHDGETPLMGRLAVHDPEDDYFIFVNRKGVKIRKVSRQELLKLIDNGLVDILEMSSNFRDEVNEVRKNLDQQ